MGPCGFVSRRVSWHGHDWASQRRKPVLTDPALTGAALDWVMGLPPVVRPHPDCEQLPRAVNTITESWSDVRYSFQIMDHLIEDYRGGRRGFPAAVKIELDALYECQRRRIDP
jgi:hypothetical protein